MKKTLSILLIIVLCLSCALSFAGCGSNTNGGGNGNGGDNGNSSGNNDDPQATPVPADIDASAVDVLTETWVATELSFTTDKTYDTKSWAGVFMDATFTNRETGTSLTIPSFWDGDNVYKIRFAPTEYGIWDYTTKCDTDDSLNGKTGTVGANAYKGDLDIYKHGFVTVDPEKKYFVYADGTPFFYLGDTHWGMYTEEIDEKGPHAKGIETDSHFKYIVDKRVEQGFTVYQSEPIGNSFNISTGTIRKAGISGFQKADRYYQYIAEKGLVHANAEFFFASEMSRNLAKNDAALELLSRYWVARFGAYPVMWTLAQEIDNDFYYERGDQNLYDYTENPWVKVAAYMHKYDAYAHPLTGHQENTGATTVTGKGTGGKSSGSGISAFTYEEAVKNNYSTGHNWWASQWSPSLTGQLNDAVPKDYWASSKVAINYESRYCYLWTKNFGARVEGWASYLSGMYGYGYGAIDMWLYKSTYDIDKDSSDGIETITKADKAVYWSDAIEFESAYQVGYMRQFFEKLEWWKLVPDFNDHNHFAPNSGAIYVCATQDSDVYVLYLYNKSTVGGTLRSMADGKYTVQWFNPRTNEYMAEETVTVSGGAYKVEKPDAEDWVLLAKKA